MKWIDFIRANAMFLGGITLVALLILTVSAKSAEAQPSAVLFECVTVTDDQDSLSAGVVGGDYPTVAHLVGSRIGAFLDVVGQPDVDGIITDVLLWPNVFKPYLTFITIYVEGCRAKHANLPADAMLYALNEIGVTPHTFVPPMMKGPAI